MIYESEVMAYIADHPEMVVAISKQMAPADRLALADMFLTLARAWLDDEPAWQSLLCQHVRGH